MNISPSSISYAAMRGKRFTEDKGVTELEKEILNN
jgi:hypothetical protein